MATSKPSTSLANKPSRTLPTKSNSPPRMVKVPFILHKNYQEAERLLREAGLNPRTEQGMIAYRFDMEEKVAFSKPRSSELVPAGSTVNLNVFRKMSAGDGTVEGTWDCSCNGRWTFLDPKGKSATHDEPGVRRKISGAIKGRQYIFRWSDPKHSGTGVITFNSDFTEGKWTKTTSQGQSWSGTMTKDDGRDRRYRFTNAGINLVNKTGETLYLQIQYSAGKRSYSTSVTVPAGYSGPLKGSNGIKIAASTINIAARGASGRQYGQLSKKLVEKPYRAKEMGMHNLNFERRKR